MSYAQMVLEREITQVPITNERDVDLNTTRVIFFAGDAIPPHEKYEMPEVKGFGGIYMPHILTLPKGDCVAAQGMVYKCALTPLTSQMQHECKDMLPPDARENWETGFSQTIIENGVPTTKILNGFMGSNLLAAKKGRFELEESDHIVSKKRFAGHDVRQATQRSLPNGPGGVVEITALMGATNVEIKEAQYFFFPNWDRIVAGVDELPFEIQGVEKLIRARLAAVPDTFKFDTAKTHKFQTIGREMLKSCSEYTRTSMQIVQKDEAAVKAAAKDDSQTHSPFSEHVLDQVLVKRKGDLLQGDHGAINRLATIMEQKETGASDIEAQKLQLEERKQYVAEVQAGMRERDDEEEIRLGIKKAAPTVTISQGVIHIPAGIEVVNDTTSEGFASEPSTMATGDSLSSGDESVAICGAPTANGECKRERKEGSEFCWQHGAK